jgi:SAM-dependent methyltransferase
MSQTIKLEYGMLQPLLSGKMQKNPLLSKIINKVLGYTNIGNYARSRVFRKQITLLPLEKMQSVLDLGCGYGEYSFMMAKGMKHAHLMALDIDQDALRNVRYAQSKMQLPNLTIHEGYLNTLKDDTFDLIYSVDVFEHIHEEQMPFKDALAKLKTGGYLMVKMPHVTQSSVFPKKWFHKHEEWLQHEHPGQVYTLKQLRDRFEKEGFKVVYTAQTDGILSRFAWETAYLMKKGGPVAQLISLPFCKLMIQLDMWFSSNNHANGNAITVIGQKSK